MTAGAALPPVTGRRPEQTQPLPLVGRGREVELWREMTRRARTGSGGVAVVTGEAGIGKSRLVEEFLRLSGPAHAIVGAAPPVAGIDLPYAPILQGLREMSRHHAPREWQRLASYWPAELAPLLWPPAGDAPPADPAASVTVPDLPVSRTAQVRFFESLLRGIVRLAQDRPVVFVVEDLHWADRSTVDLLAMLASNVRVQPVLLVLTARNELERDHPLRAWLAEVNRLPHSHDLCLSRLSRPDTGELLSGLLDGVAPAAVVERIYARSEGNPLFSELLLPDARSDTSALPPLLRDLLSARFAGLTAAGRRVLGAASVAGRRVPYDLLQDVLQVPETELDQGLRELVDRQLLRPVDSGGIVEFRSELFREAAYDDVMPGARAALHRSLADALSARADPAVGGPGVIAHHYVAAREWERALPADLAAGLSAESTFAYAEALQHLSRAADTWVRVPEAARRDAGGHAAILARAAQAADLLGDGELALRLVGRALDAVDRSDLAAVALLQERRGTYNYNVGNAPEARGAFMAALELLPAEPAGAERARVLASLALLDMAWTHLDGAATAARESIRIAQAVHAPREEGRARNALGVVTAYAGNFDSGVEHLRAAVRLARQASDPDDLADALINLGHVLGVTGRYDEAVQVCLEGYETARTLGLEREHGSFLLANAADCLVRLGRWAEADRLLADALAGAPRGLRAFPVLMQAAWLALRRGAFPDAAREVAAVRVLLDEGGGGPSGWRREMLEAEAEVAAWERRAQDAYRAVNEGLQLAQDADEQRFAGALVATGLRVAADEAERERARRNEIGSLGTQETGTHLYDRARQLDPCPVVRGSGPMPDTAALAATCSGELSRMAGRPDAEPWQQAADAWRSLDRPYEQAYAEWRAAEALFGQDRAGPASLALRSAHATATRLGAAGLQEEIVALAAWRRVSLDVAAVPAAAAIVDTLGLTAREHEVLGLVTAGRTNREIAEALFISGKTASVHVSNILRKLGVTSRVDAARIARQCGQPARPGPTG